MVSNPTKAPNTNAKRQGFLLIQQVLSLVRYQEVPAQNVVLYYVLMEFGNRTCAYLYQAADVLAVVLVRVVPVLVQKFSTGWFFQKKSVQITHKYPVRGYR